tara:strand:+ start:365 stop:730 length:366 start_codon:yes stop_codon:yes gene_type:complete
MKTCLFCNETLKGRSDKKFCDDSCRNAFNNKKSAKSNNLMRRVNRILSKNRKILKDHYSQNQNRINKETLMYKGFVFNYFTSVYENSIGEKFFFIYDLGYCYSLENNHEVQILYRNEKELI